MLNLPSLVANFPLINPSLLACDFTRLGDEIRDAEIAGAKILHLDIMDAHFVPNLSFGIPVVEAIRRSTDLPLDVHLMLDEPWRYIKPFRLAGADMLTVHIEVLPDPRWTLETIHRSGAAAGLAINPPTPVEMLLPFVCECDIVLTMSVMPGFGGQKFDAVALEKLKAIRKAAGKETLLSVDGGVNEKTIAQCASAGANTFVAGTAFFGVIDRKKRMTELYDASKSNDFLKR
ncbi:MAG: ribulose-phosphate 3-epimerase [Planctomycetaceae bacterium]|jgi:ribulose-phosphate 3-epimerase|nr:ribulose-phosphate 3-epimerase [Planctomycetaceae bacterium]